MAKEKCYAPEYFFYLLALYSHNLWLEIQDVKKNRKYLHIVQYKG